MDLAPCPFCGEDEMLTAGEGRVVCLVCQGAGPIDNSREQAIANWNRRPTSTLTIPTGEALPSTGHNIDARGWFGTSKPAPVGDELAAARERRDLASLPSISTTAEQGLSMDFDLGGPPPKGKR